MLALAVRRLTPRSTAILREITAKGNEARFERSGATSRSTGNPSPIRPVRPVAHTPAASDARLSWGMATLRLPLPPRSPDAFAPLRPLALAQRGLRDRTGGKSPRAANGPPGENCFDPEAATTSRLTTHRIRLMFFGKRAMVSIVTRQMNITAQMYTTMNASEFTFGIEIETITPTAPYATTGCGLAATSTEFRSRTCRRVGRPKRTGRSTTAPADTNARSSARSCGGRTGSTR